MASWHGIKLKTGAAG